MMIQMVLLPVFILAALTFAALLLRGGDDAKSAGAGGGFGYHLHTLFYVLVALAIPTRHADLIMVLLAWVFVVLQVFQAGFFTAATATRRSAFFTAGVLVLLAMWLYFAIRVLFPI